MATLPACGSSGGAGVSPGKDAAGDSLQDGPPADRAVPEGSTDGLGSQEASADGSCEATPVWNAASLTFTLTSTGGFVAPPPPDAGCTAGTGVSFDFSLPDATLTKMGCNFSGRFDSLVHLSPADVASVVASVGAIRTTCARNGCGAGAPTTKLTVSASGTQTIYTGDFYSGCPGSMDTPPFVPYGSLGQLQSTLQDIVARSCAADAGAGDGGTCVNR